MGRGFICSAILLVSVFGLLSCRSDKTPVHHQPDDWQVRAPQIGLPENPGHSLGRSFEVNLYEVKTIPADAEFSFPSLGVDVNRMNAFTLRANVACMQNGKSTSASFSVQNQAKLSIATLLPDELLQSLDETSPLVCSFQFIATNSLGSTRTLDAVHFNLIQLNKITNWNDPVIAASLKSGHPIEVENLHTINLSPNLSTVDFTKGTITMACDHFLHQEEFSYQDPNTIGSLIASVVSSAQTAVDRVSEPNGGPLLGRTQQSCRLLLRPSDATQFLERFLSPVFKVQFAKSELTLEFTKNFQEPELPSPDGASIFSLDVYNPAPFPAGLRLTNTNQVQVLIDATMGINMATTVAFTGQAPFSATLNLQTPPDVWRSETGNQVSLEIPAGEHVQIKWRLSTPVRCRLPPPPPAGLSIPGYFAGYTVRLPQRFTFEHFLNWDDEHDLTAPTELLVPEATLNESQPNYWFPNSFGREHWNGESIPPLYRAGSICH